MFYIENMGRERQRQDLAVGCLPDLPVYRADDASIISLVMNYTPSCQAFFLPAWHRGFKLSYTFQVGLRSSFSSREQKVDNNLQVAMMSQINLM